MSAVMQEEFQKYNSLINYNKEYVDTHIIPSFGHMKAVVTEKLHGANLMVAYDGTNFRYARRRGWLKEGESFHGLEYIKEPLESLLKRAFEQTREVIMEHHKAADEVEARGEEAVRPSVPRDFQVMRVRGEFFGGGYEHPDVPKVKGMSQIQGGVQYAQDKSFSVFQVEFDDVVLPFDEMFLFCRSFGIPYVPVLHTGTLEECVEWSQEHRDENTVIPYSVPRLNADGSPVLKEDESFYESLPLFDEGENIREGHIILPYEPVSLPNGKRLVIKDKYDKFSECKPPKKPKLPPEPLEGTMGILVERLTPYLTENRFHNVRSHEGTFQRKDMKQAVGLVVKDAMDECFVESGASNLAWCELSAKERKQVSRELHRICTLEIREAFLSTAV